MTKTSIGFVSVVCIVLMYSTQSNAQGKTKKELSEDYRPVQSAVPFLTICTDSRSSAMGEVGACSEPDVWSMHWNPAKYGFVANDLGVGVSYTPWMKNIGVKDVFQAYMSGYKKVGSMQTIGASFQYFNLGTIAVTTEDGIETGSEIRPREFSFDAAYARKLSKEFSFSLAFRYIFSDLTNNISVAGGGESRPGQSYAADISGYYQKKVNLGAVPSLLRGGFSVSNIGAKMSYSVTSEKEFIPTNLRLGLGTTMSVDKYNDFAVNIDANKLLVPTPPYEYYDEKQNKVTIGSGDKEASPTSAIFNSFTDAPGGAAEELNEIIYNIGLEYWYVKQFAVRAGYYLESKTKGARRYLTAGVGLRFSAMTFDAGYIIANGASPLSNTWRVSISYEIASANKATTPGNTTAPLN